jgi:hypothetical protein
MLGPNQKINGRMVTAIQKEAVKRETREELTKMVKDYDHTFRYSEMPLEKGNQIEKANILSIEFLPNVASNLMS